MRLSLVIALLFTVYYSSAQSTDVSIPFKNFQYQIKGTFLEAETPIGTAAIIIPGSGPTDRNGNGIGFKSNTYKFLAEHLAANGISSLRYDKLGVGESVPGILEKDLLFYDNVKVAHAVYDFLSQQEGVERIVIIGHSEGSLVGMILSKEVQPYKYISLAGPAFPAGDVMITQFKNMPDQEMSKEAVPILESLKVGKQMEAKSKMLRSIFRPSVQNYMISWFAYDPRVEISGLKIPILILQGDNDIQVANENADELAIANPKAKKVFIPNITHVLKDGPRDRERNMASYGSSNVDIDENVKKAVIEFILE